MKTLLLLLLSACFLTGCVNPSPEVSDIGTKSSMTLIERHCNVTSPDLYIVKDNQTGEEYLITRIAEGAAVIRLEGRKKE